MKTVIENGTPETNAMQFILISSGFNDKRREQALWWSLGCKSVHNKQATFPLLLYKPSAMSTEKQNKTTQTIWYLNWKYVYLLCVFPIFLLLSPLLYLKMH